MIFDLPDGVTLRPLTESDAEPLLRAYVVNREHLAPWEPRRPPDFYTLVGQESRARDRVQLQREGRLSSWALQDEERIVGTITLSHIELGPFRSAHLGYWIDSGYTGRGLATAAANAVCRAADEQLGLHRIEAGTLLDNTASQRVLERCGFSRIGVAPRYLHIDGAWRDHVLFQRVLHDRPAI
ncbi:GNAT family protein [Streptomyces sp. YIM 130001]|uniref:GNAT family N-acetyltransferase n=1 Tax=Streptomyces sp. YIM 130001 TaxID=2259644 RepID=UPI000E64A155|nr:GNAT family protein [Streptomyces sp. YIM 130001]